MIEKKIPKNKIDIKDIYPRVAEQIDLIIEKIKAKKQGKFTILISGSSGVGKTALACDLAKKLKFSFTKIINVDKLIGLGESSKADKIFDVYFDSLKCESSCLIFDEIIDLIEYVPLDKHYSRTLFQGFV